ncbi:MAG: hypothetical protein AAFX50_01395, partial [Acidobacteriota bacterium]
TYFEIDADAGYLLPSTLHAQVEDFVDGAWSTEWSTTGPVTTSLVAPAPGSWLTAEWDGVERRHRRAGLVVGPASR